MDGKSVGRSRGRARGTLGPANSQVAASAYGRRGPAPPQSAAPPPPSEPSTSSAISAPPIVGRSVRAPTPFVGPYGETERLSAPRRLPAVELAAPGPGGDVTSSAGRGAIRGRRIISAEILNTRPQHVAQSKKGTSGNAVQLVANYFKILSKPDWCLFQYRVDLAPDIDHTGIRKAMVRQHRETLGTYIFDGTVLFSSNRLTPQGQNLVLFSQRKEDPDTPVQITLKLVGDLARGDPHYLQFYNILMRKCLEYLNLQLVGRDYYDAKARVEVREYLLDLWPGYLTTIRQHETDLLMCVEVTHKIMRQETILDVMERAREEAGRRGGDYQNACRAEILGMTVLTGYNNNTYRIDDIDFKVSAEGTFAARDGSQIRYMDYYKQKYNITIKNEKQPLLVTRSTGRDRRAGKDDVIYLIPELCRTTGLTEKMRNDFRLMSALNAHTRITPDKRIEKLLAFNRRMNTEPSIKTEFTQWNLQLDTQLVKVPGRTLLKERIHFGGGANVDAGLDGDWTRAIRDNALYLTIPLTQWVVVVPERLTRDARSFVSGMVRSTKNFAISEPQFIELRSDRSDQYTDALEKCLSKVNPQIVLCILMKNRADTYSAIKKKLCIDRPVPSQVVTARCFNPKGIMSIATKVAIQMNCKIGGIPWNIHIPAGGIMVVGYDVCHDTNKKGTDFGAMVASLDRNLTRFYSAVSAHTTGEELSNHLGINMVKALTSYKNVNNGSLPSRIIFYRDGVGEGQIPFVADHELAKVNECVNNVYNGAEPPKLGYIIVTKRINTKFFQGTRNPLPGTVVDDVITNGLKYDFFLISQAVKQGTVSPTAYNVIYDTLSLTPDQLQILTYKMTHVYYNCSTTMRVPAPVQFAHKLAFLVSEALHTAPTSASLANLLYFL